MFYLEIFSENDYVISVGLWDKPGQAIAWFIKTFGEQEQYSFSLRVLVDGEEVKEMFEEAVK